MYGQMEEVRKGETDGWMGGRLVGERLRDV